MPIHILIPTPLRKYTNEQDTVTAEGGTVAALIADLDRQFPGIAARLTDDSGELRRFVNIYLNEEDIRFLSGKETPVKDGDSVSIVPAIAGGAPNPEQANRRPIRPICPMGPINPNT